MQPLAPGARVLRCPDCDLALQSFACGETRVEKCAECHGIWFGHRAFGTFQDLLRGMNLQRLEVLLTPRALAMEAISACPHCEEVLEPFRYAYNSRVMLQRCRPCRGLWRPLRELAQLVELAKISQDIAPHVAAVLSELERVEASVLRDREIASRVRRLSSSVW